MNNEPKNPVIPLDCKWAKISPPKSDPVIGKRANFLGRRNTAGI
jgi:hypothetical protein